MSEKVTHFIWCALVAVEIARSDGLIRTREGEQHFIIKWLQEAQKKKLFCREVAPLLLALLKFDRLYGVSVSLRETLYYYWQLDSGSMGKQTDFYRLNCALTLLKLFETQRVFLPLHNHSRDSTMLSNKETKILIDKKTLSCAFDKNGNLIVPLMMKVEFDIHAVEAIMKKCCFHCTIYGRDIIKLNV